MPMPRIQWSEDMDEAIRDNWHLPLSMISDIVGVSRWAMKGRINQLSLPERNLSEVRRAAQLEFGRIG